MPVAAAEATEFGHEVPQAVEGLEPVVAAVGDQDVIARLAVAHAGDVTDAQFIDQSRVLSLQEIVY